MNDAIDVMEHLPFGVPTLKRDLNGLTQAVSARNRGFFYADHIDRTPAGQWVVLKRVRALVPFNTADPRALPLEPDDTTTVVLEHPSSWAVGTNAAWGCGVFLIDKYRTTDPTDARFANETCLSAALCCSPSNGLMTHSTSCVDQCAVH